MSRHTQVELLFSEYIRSMPLIKQELKRADFESVATDLNGIPKLEYLRPLDVQGRCLPIAAVDASSNLIGYSGGRAYELLRAAIVLRRGNDKVRLIKLGPFITRSSSERGSFLFELETMAQRLAARRIKNGIVLFDGTALESLDSEFPLVTIPSTNSFISLSKVMPTQSLDGEGRMPKGPFIAKVEEGDSFLVRLSTDGFILRAMASTKDADETTWLFSCLTRSDSIEMGYPRAMKLAHIYSKILPMDIISARLALFEKHNIKARDPIDGRKLLLGCMWG